MLRGILVNGVSAVVSALTSGACLWIVNFMFSITGSDKGEGGSRPPETRLRLSMGEIKLPADQTTYSGLTWSKTFPASVSLFMSSRLETSTSTLPFFPSPNLRISSLWSALRTTLVTFHDRASSKGVRCKEILPCPPRRRTLGVAIVSFWL